ncbi:hypothetical protein BMW24_003385 [Mycobacterium heckeshornense]|uniref:hypothetical protein n=1 Tax=Mycobacterium heckeshornense TaxID=110505 RepID=UPI0008FCE397|nr:hypothetical protein [Mycobacterium heckeshornense]PIJ36723.1 hypothetical protein BMW24_003100 [Mycobacterium heckeshornense]PIJ36774.1 hypothetical protein BMW24_003385 [Mycobacterium heckeshornense]
MTLNLVTINGTGSYPTDPTNFPSMVALALLPSGWQIVADKLDGLATVPLINWLPLDYPMAIYPMGASENTGIANTIALIQSTPAPIAVAAYSQGADVWSKVWRDHVLNPDGELHDRLNDFVAAVTWGNPHRAPNVCNGNDYAGWAHQSGGGIAGTDDLLPDQIPPWWLDFANPNDLYTDSPVSVSGGKIVMTDTAIDEQLIYNMVVTQNFGGTLEGLLTLVEQAVEQFTNPLAEVIGIATAIWNGLTFAAAGPAAGHYTYDPTPAISYLQQIATQYA